MSPKGSLRFEHDHYMKMWAMTSPVLDGKFILLDEAQDTNPVLEEVFLAQDAQRVCVGDPAQQISGWRQLEGADIEWQIGDLTRGTVGDRNGPNLGGAGTTRQKVDIPGIR